MATDEIRVFGRFQRRDALDHVSSPVIQTTWQIRSLGSQKVRGVDWIGFYSQAFQTKITLVGDNTTCWLLLVRVLVLKSSQNTQLEAQ